MADNKQLMRLSAPELIAMGAQVGLTFHTGMKKSQMVQQLSSSVATGWMEVNAGLMGGIPEDDGISGSFGDASMISDAAHVAQMISGAGLTETFHAAMAGPSAHVEAVHTYMEQIGVSADDVWMHMPKANPNVPAGHWGSLNKYMRDTLGGHQDIMPEIPGHYSGDILGEYATDKGGVQSSYEHLAHMYLDKSQYASTQIYEHDVASVATRLASSMGSRFGEVAFSSAIGAHVSYMSALPQIGDPSIVGSAAYPRQPLNVSGLPLGAEGHGIRSEYSLSASVTGTPGWSDASKAVHSSVSESVKSLAGVYRGETGMEGRRHVTSERDMIMDSASRYADIADVRSGYENLKSELADDPRYSATNIRSIIENKYDRMDAQAAAAPSGVADPSFRLPSVAETGTAFTTQIDGPTDYNVARARRESIAIANLDSIPWKDIEEPKQGPVRFHDLEQGTDEWLDFRKQYDITGSTVGSFLGSNPYTRPWAEMVDKVGLKRGKPISEFTQRMFDAGHKTEEEARVRVSKELGMDIRQTGAITHEDYPSFMYSPDGLIGDDAIWEHKNPERAGKFADLAAGDHPDYMDQIQFGMHVSGRSRALFSQTIGKETRSQWFDKDEGWYERNKAKLDSISGRLAAGREFVASHSDLSQEELIKGARAVMMGDGIWKDISQKSDRGYSPTAGTLEDPFIQAASRFDMSTAAAAGAGGVENDQLALSVKKGILAAQEDNRQKRGISAGGRDADFGDGVDWDQDRFDAATGGGGFGGGGGRRGWRSGGSFGDDFGAVGGRLAAGIAGGSLASAGSGAMNAMMMTPWGRGAAVAIGAMQIGNEVAEDINEYVGRSLDAGVVNPIEYSSMTQGMQMLGASEQQATQVNRTTHGAYNTLLNGDPSAAIRIVQGTRGLITIGDIRSTEGDPVALARIMQERGRERGWSQQRIAGAVDMAGLDGMARSYDMPQYSHDRAGEVVASGRGADYSRGVAESQVLQTERASVLPSYLARRGAIEYGGAVMGEASDAIVGARTAVSGAISGARNVYDFIAGEESGGRDYDAQGRVITSPTGAKGRMQVLDSTARDPGFNVTPARDGSLEERARVGRDLYDAMYKRYGSHDKAMAAYTDGAGTLDKAIEQHGSDWLTAMPMQAQNRVAAWREFQRGSQGLGEGATGFTRNGVSYGQTPTTVVQVNIDAKVNSQQASATVSVPGGASASQQINVGNGYNQRR